MKITIDRTSCLQSGQCAYMQPGVFQLDAAGLPQLAVGVFDETTKAAARDAAAMCPSQAIGIEDDDDRDVFTTLHRSADTVIRATLGIPDHVRIAATIPIGYPDVNFGAGQTAAGPVLRTPQPLARRSARFQPDQRNRSLM